MATLTLPQFAGLMTHLASSLPAARHRALEHACQIVETEARRVIGTYDADPTWPELADSTKADRVRQGFSENEPLLRTGELRDSIVHTVVGNTGHVGSNDDKAVWQELGTVRIPPRSFLKSAVIREAPAIEHVIGRAIHAHLSSGVFPSAAGVPFNRHDDPIR